MPEVGDIEYKYRRNYILVNPDAEQGPPTWRLAAPQEIGMSGGGGGGTGAAYDFDGVPPIVVRTRPSGGRTKVETSMDIQSLDSRE